MEFTLTFWSWLGLISNLVTIAITPAVFLVMLGVARWRQANRWFLLFLISVFGWVASGQFTNFLFWLNQGDPLVLFWISLAFFSISGVTLLGFTNNIIGLRSKLLEATIVAGTLISLVAILLLVQGMVVTDVWLNETGLLRYKITPLGYALSALPFIYEIGTLGLLIYHRKRVNDNWIILGVASLAFGPILSILQLERLTGVPIPYSALGTVIGVSTVGYTMARRHVFDPLHQLTFELEHQVEERTHELEQASETMHLANETLNRRAAQLQTTIEITHEVASIPDLEEMSKKTVQLIHSRLGYRYVALYLIDQRDEWAKLEASAGEAIHPLTETERRVRVGSNTPIGHVIASGNPRLASSVSASESFEFSAHQETTTNYTSLGHSLLPGTRTGMILPLKVGKMVIGALYLQSSKETSRDEAEVAMLQTLTDYLVITIENTRLLQRTQTQLDELTDLYRRHSHQTWQRIPTGLALTYRHGQFQSEDIPLEASKPSEERSAYSKFIDWKPDDALGSSSVSLASEEATLNREGNLITVPVNLRGEIIGRLGFRKDETNADWTASERSLVEAVVSQMALALENAQLYQESQQRAQREQAVSEISDRIRSTMDWDTILKTSVRELSRALRASEGLIRLGTPDQLMSATGSSLDHDGEGIEL